MKMDIVVDIQCVKDCKNRVVPKEVTVLSLNQNFTGHWIVSPNSQITALCQEARKENDWLSRNYHGLDWLDQGVSEKVLFKYLEEICRRENNIYVRGGMKVAILRKITARHIINLEFEEDCPPFHKLTASGHYCMHHALKFGFSKFSCTLNNASKLKTWLNTRGKRKLMKSSSLNHLLISVMNNIQIQPILSQILAHDTGVFAADQIPLVWTRPTACIFNTQRHDKPGLHWVAIYVNKNGDAWYFDSFGVPPYISYKPHSKEC